MTSDAPSPIGNLSAALRSYWIATALLVGSSLVIIVTNNIMSIMVGLLVDYEKHWTVSSQEDSIAIKSFILETFNTAFITVSPPHCNTPSSCHPFHFL